MGFFDDDNFDDLVRGFFGTQQSSQRNGRTVITGEEEERTIDFLEDGDYAYLMFEVPGFNEKDCIVSVKGNELIIATHKKDTEKIQPYLKQKLQKAEKIKKLLPKFINSKRFKHTVRNGVIEIIFVKK